PGAPAVRRRRGEPVLRGTRPGGQRVPGVPHVVPREGDPGAPLLGELRPRRDALLWPSRAASSWRRSRVARRRDPGGIQPRGLLGGVLAGWRRGGERRLLLVRLSGAGGLREGEGSPGSCGLRCEARRVPASLR